MNLMTEKKKYIKPITESFPMIEEDFVAKSPNTEEFNNHTDSEQDGWDNVDPDSIPVLDEDEDIWG